MVDMMNVILGLVVSLGCCSLICSAATNPALSVISTEVKNNQQFSFRCTVRGDLRWGYISFLHNYQVMCEMYLTTNPWECQQQITIPQGYACSCESQYNYKLTINSFGITSVGSWSCSSLRSNNKYPSNTITLYSSNPFLSAVSVKTEQNKAFTFRCTAIDDARWGYVSFFKNNQRMCTFYNAKNLNCYQYGTTVEGYTCSCETTFNYYQTYTLEINSFGIRSAGNWSCGSKLSGINYKSNDIGLYSEPERVTITGNRRNFTADGVKSLYLKCSTSITNCQVNFVWMNQKTNAALSSTGQIYTQPYTAGYTYTNTLTISPLWYQDGDEITCKVQAINVANSKVVSDSITLDLIYPPTGKPVIKGYTPGTPVLEGTMLNISCEVKGGKPSVSVITLTCDGIGSRTSEERDGEVIVRYIWFTVLRSHNDKTCRCSADHQTNQYKKSTTFTIFVNYVPRVNIYKKTSPKNKTLHLICEASGRPASYVFSAFSHIWRGEKIRELPGKFVSPNKYELTIHPYSYRDSGVYQCTVSNSITGINNSKLQIANTTVNIKAPPKLVDSSTQNETVVVSVGDALTLKKIIFSRTNISSYQWTKPDGNNRTGYINAIHVTLNIYNIAVDDTGYSVCIEFAQIGEDDIGEYILQVCNAFGCGLFYSLVQVAESSPMEPASSNPILIPAASGAAGAVILLVVIIVIVCFVRRRNTRKNKNKTTDDTVRQNNTITQLDNSEMEDNELYAMSNSSENPVMEDNELYGRPAKRKEVNLKPGNVSAVYSVANQQRKSTPEEKHALTEEEIAAMYTVVNKGNNSKREDNSASTEEEIAAMYTVVNKGNKAAAGLREKPVKGKPKDDVKNELSEDVSNLYTQVNKNKQKSKQKREGKVVGDMVEYVNTPGSASVYQNF